MEHHAFGSTRTLPLGVPDPSLRYCDTCGQTVNALIHNVSNEENGEAIIAALDPPAQPDPRHREYSAPDVEPECDFCGERWPCSGARQPDQHEEKAREYFAKVLLCDVPLWPNEIGKLAAIFRSVYREGHKDGAEAMKEKIRETIGYRAAYSSRIRGISIPEAKK
jgi:hypothetical protein